MKSYSIGRDVNCDIVISDSTDVVSRRHAILNVTSIGKMTIIDQSSNGTYVNGIRISSNVPVPVTRKDTISLAHVTKLDWNCVPRSNIFLQYGLYGVIAILLFACIAFGVNHLQNKGSQDENVSTISIDSLEKIKKSQLDSIVRAAKADSIRRDSLKRIEKTRQDSINRTKRNAKDSTQQKSAKKEEPKAQSKPKQDVG